MGVLLDDAQMLRRFVSSTLQMRSSSRSASPQNGGSFEGRARKSSTVASRRLRFTAFLLSCLGPRKQPKRDSKNFFVVVLSSVILRATFSDGGSDGGSGVKGRGKVVVTVAILSQSRTDSGRAIGDVLLLLIQKLSRRSRRVVC